jgi:GT2 family glycosyltransferase
VPTTPTAISIVIPAFRADATLGQVLEALAGEIDETRHEVILVESGGGGAAERLTTRFPWLRLIALEQRTLPGAARNLGAEAATGELLAFLDADAVPAPGWLEGLRRGLRPELEAVAGAVVNGTPLSPTGTAGYLLEFSDWFPRRRAPRLRHAAGCSLLIRRSAFERLGGFEEEIWPGEDTVLTFRLGEGGTLGFAPTALVRHLNRRGLRAYLRHQRRLGIGFAEVCSRVDFPGRPLARRRLAPIAALLWLASRMSRLLPHPREALTALVLTPLICAGAVAWGVGLWDAKR